MTSNPTEQPKMHFRVLDSWRGIAALMVALFHLNILSVVYSLDLVRNSYLFVDFFFVLSGFVITHSYADRLGTLGGVGKFVLRRLGRLWPLHVVILLALLVIEGGRAISAARGTSFYIPPFTGTTSLHSIFTNLAFAQSFGIERQLTWNPPSWSICAEFWTYLIFAAAIFAGAKWFGRIRFATEALLAVLMIGSAGILIAFAQHGIDATYDLGFIRCIYGFLVGHLTYRLWQTTYPIKFRTGLIEVGALIAVVAYVSAAGHSAYTFLAPFVFGAAVFAFAFEAGPVSSLMLNRGNAWLGRISYSVYMWQAFIIFNFVDRPVSMMEKMTGHAYTTTESAPSAFGGETEKLIVLGGHVLPILATLLFIGLLVAVASASYYLIEIPGQQLFARLAGWLGARWLAMTNRHRSPSLVPGEDGSLVSVMVYAARPAGGFKSGQHFDGPVPRPSSLAVTRSAVEAVIAEHIPS